MVVLACDLGGTRIKAGLVQEGQVLTLENLPADSGRGVAAGLPSLAATLRRVAAAEGIALENCAGVSMSFPSLIDMSTGRVLAAYGKYQDAPEIDLRAWVRQELGLPLAIENDARMALIGEWQHGAGRGCDNLVMLTLGTGLGTSAIIQGRVLRGKHGQAGCLGGHLTVRYGGRPCTCGNHGCAEAEASTAFLGELARSRTDFGNSALAGEPVLDYAAVFRLAAKGDECAQAIRNHSLLVWSAAVVNLIHAYDPEVVILGGGIMASAEVVLPAVQEHVARCAHTPWGKVRVVPSELGDRAALVASEWLLVEQFPHLRT
jgi:glucokinase